MRLLYFRKEILYKNSSIIFIILQMNFYYFRGNYKEEIFIYEINKIINKILYGYFI